MTDKQIKLNLLESIEVNKHKNCELFLNDQVDINRSPLWFLKTNCTQRNIEK